MLHGSPPPPPLGAEPGCAALGRAAAAAVNGSPQGPVATGVLLWDVASQNVTSDMGPGVANAGFPRGPAWDDDASSMGSSMPNSLYDSACGSAHGSRAGSVAGGPPGLTLPLPPGLNLVDPCNVMKASSEAESAGTRTTYTGGAVSKPPVGEPGTPLVLWCEAKPTKQQEVMDALAAHPAMMHRQVIYFQTPARLTRWLFEQPRGDVVPWALLITGWREAKPCAMAIGAARSGDVSQLRPDARRPDLPPVFGVPKENVETAIESMVIVLEKSKEEARVVQWAKDGGHALARLDIHVAGDSCTAHDVMARLGRTTPVSTSRISL